LFRQIYKEVEIENSQIQNLEKDHQHLMKEIYEKHLSIIESTKYKFEEKLHEIDLKNQEYMDDADELLN
jgi:hypothetical protein